MSGPSLTVVIPVLNQAAYIGETLRSAAWAARSSPFATDFVVVDDGSTDGTAEAARQAGIDQPVTVVSQPNQGRLAARRTGLTRATGEYVLFVDSRVRLDPTALAFVAARLEHGEQVWNAHVKIETDGNPYAKFWDVLTGLAFGAYFSRPRTTSFTKANFDAFPKGTTGFLAPTPLLQEAFAGFRSRYADARHANDDTPILRWIAGQQPIHISPSFSCRYTSRRDLRGFVRHAFHRGVVFVDGHGRPESAYFPAVVAFYPVSLAGLVLSARHPIRTGGVLALLAGGAGVFALARGRRVDEAAAFAALSPFYAVAHAAGMWRGLGLVLAGRVRRSLDAQPR